MAWKTPLGRALVLTSCGRLAPAARGLLFQNAVLTIRPGLPLREIETMSSDAHPESRASRRRGTLGYRLLIGFLSILLTLLLTWLLGFVARDLDRIEGPAYSQFEEEELGVSSLDRLTELGTEQADLTRQIERARERQSIYQRDTASSRQTLEQLLEFHRVRIEKGNAPSEDEQRALAESQRRFLEYQQRFLDANVEIERLSEELADSRAAQRTLEASLAPRRETAREKWDDASKSHRFRIATYKLSILLPVFVFAAWIAASRRRSAYSALWFSLLVASSWRLGLVIHDHFPTEVFKYVALGVGIAILVAAMVLVIRRVVRPTPGVLLKQIREAYPKQRCPVCTDPIRRGPLKRATWTRKGPSSVVATTEDVTEEREKPYTCPSCGTRLFEACDDCGAMRHSLLPYCETCGAAKETEGDDGGLERERDDS